MSVEQSEFGRGIVVCLAKFSEHLWNGREPTDLAGVSDRDLFIHARDGLAEDEVRAKAYSSLVEMWANGASDHFYELDPKAPDPLRELASLTLEMGHGFTGKTWTPTHMKRVRDLWKESCLAVDVMLCVATEWGEF